ncbi:MAG: FecR domain-containing protein [Bacteriovoracaceae bacterium]|nr:FecR domain-containing protein [Bacteriovoracaceae bacterium]
MYAIYPSIKGKKQILRKGTIIKGNVLLKSGKKSFAKVKFKDGSIVFIGPKSKLAISQINVRKPTFIELLRGKMRAIVNKNSPLKKGYNHKMYVQTRSASIGVRGTDFYLTYNDKNHITSNITLSGDVSMYKKTDQLIHESIREEFDGRQVIRFGQDKHIQNTDDHLQHRYTKSIKRGRFSGSFPSYDKPLAPIHISLQQLNALSSNDNMGTGARGNIIKGKFKARAQSSKNSYLIPKPYHKAIASDDSKENIDQYLGARPGGHVDLKTGLYISPPTESKINEATGLYDMPDDLGGIDSNSGEYIPPDGVILHPIKGFMASDKNYGNRDFKKNLQKLTKLSGGLTDKIQGVVKIFKEITRSDLYAQLNYNYTTRVTEDYYGEHREITDAPSMLWNAKGFYGFQIYHNKRYLWYVKGALSALYHERTLPEVKRNNTYTGNIGFEFHRKHTFNNKKARFVADLLFTTSYMDYRKRNLFDFYTENTGLRLSEKFQFNRYNVSELYYQIKAFQGFEDANHGNIHHVGLTHRFIFGNNYDLMFGYDYNQRREKMIPDHYTIRNGFFKAIRKDLIFRTDLSIEYSFQHHNSKNNVRFDDARYYKIQLELNKRLGEFWKLNGTYQYERQRANGEIVRSSFIKQTWGGGLVMVF